MSRPTTNTGLSRKLLTRVLSVYFILTVIVTGSQIFAEYLSTKHRIEDELSTLKNTFSVSLTRAIWELNTPQALSIAEGLVQLPIVEGVQVRDETGEYIANLGNTKEKLTTSLKNDEIQEHRDGLFGYSFPLVFQFSGNRTQVGEVTLYSSFDVVFSRIEVGVFFLIGNAIIKTAFLVFLFMLAFRSLLSKPLVEMTTQMGAFDADHPQQSKIVILDEDDNELQQLRRSYNQVLDNLARSQNKLQGTQKELEQAYQQLDKQNTQLEQEVLKKTHSLSQMMHNLEQQKDELIASQRQLRKENDQRKRAEQELLKRNAELNNSIEVLNQTKDQLVESERMASLGGLVAGITHEVNTPLGTSLTATSVLQDNIKQLQQQYENKTITHSQMQLFLNNASQSANLLQSNLQRASSLIASFKQVSVDQTSEAERTFSLNTYLEEIVQTLAPYFTSNVHKITVSCPPDIFVRCAPGVIAQLLTNMVINSLTHGFEADKPGQITVSVKLNGSQLYMVYQDDGKGLAASDLAQIFNAFFTTRRDSGGSGLGTHIMYNLVTQSLNGTISAASVPGEGLRYDIKFPQYQL
nr:HAMP domain-containing sensor histidine kinase [Alteromonas lipotrueiana]